MLWALHLTLGSTASADQFHCKRSLYIIIEVLIICHFCGTFHLASVVRLVALRAFEEGHLSHCQSGDSILVTEIVWTRKRTSLLNNPTLHRFLPNLLIHLVLWSNNVINARMPHNLLAEWTPDALEGKTATT